MKDVISRRSKSFLKKLPRSFFRRPAAELAPALIGKILVRRIHGKAFQARVVETDYHQKLLDYINWFEVTKDYADNRSRFETYFTTAKEMERVEADPAHPNPIRANLLQIESEL